MQPAQRCFPFEARRGVRSLSVRCAMPCWPCLRPLRGIVSDARTLARRVISQTVDHTAHEPLVDARYRRIARIIAAATCLIIGEATRGRRALSRAFDPDHTLVQSLTPQGVDEQRVSPLIRGYARLINVAAAAASENRPALGLTPAEMAVLRALPDGVTLAEIAVGFGKSKKTVERQVESIYCQAPCLESRPGHPARSRTRHTRIGEWATSAGMPGVCFAHRVFSPCGASMPDVPSSR